MLRLFGRGTVLSVTVMVDVPAVSIAVGVPAITPAWLIAIPAGSPVALKVYGGVPPAAPQDTSMGVMAIPVVDAGIL